MGQIEELIVYGVMEARQAKSASIRPAHLFIGACRMEARGLMAALNSIGIDGVRLRRRLRALAVEPGPPQSNANIELSGEAQLVLRRAVESVEGREPEADDVAAMLLEMPDAPLRQALREQKVDGATLASSVRAKRASGEGAGPPVALRTLRLISFHSW